MATLRRLSAEDANINSSLSLSATRRRDYADIDLTFTPRPSGDVYKKVDAAAVKQSVKNLISTNRLEKPFVVSYGGNVRDLLFELADYDTEIEIENQIKETLARWEPRAQFLNVETNANLDGNAVDVTLTFKIINTDQIVNFTTTLSRLR